MKVEIPNKVAEAVTKLVGAGFEAYLVGGCVRDLLLECEPKDWDVATNATPDEMQNVFGKENTVYENEFGTVLVKLEPLTDAERTQTVAEKIPRISALRQRTFASIVEVTTFRLEGTYTDKRHPDEVCFAKTIEEDLSRRDFTINAIALKCDANLQMHANAANYELVDPYGGQDDLEGKIIRTVGDPKARFQEDALRLMRAVRFATELESFSVRGAAPAKSGGQRPASSWEIEGETRRAIETESHLLEMIAKERVRDELEKILQTPHAARGIILLEELNLLQYVLPELREGLGVGQNKHHIYSVFEHNIRSLDYAARQEYSLIVRIASLLHDVGKPRVKGGDGPDSTFYNHDIVGAKMAAKMLDRLHFSRDCIEHVTHLVRYHMFYYNVGEVTDAGVRRFLRRVGTETVPDLVKLREADRIGSGVPKAVPYKLRHFLFMIEKVKHDPVSPKMLKVTGVDVMAVLKIAPGPRVGAILAVLLEEVLDNPAENDREKLLERIRELGGKSDKELADLAKRAKDVKEEFQAGIEDEMKRQFHVQ